MQEIWKSLKDIVECGDYYEVSNFGNIRSVDKISFNGVSNFNRKGKLLKIRTNVKSGYKQATICLNGLRKTMNIHRLVALAFIDNPENKSEVNHIDGDKENNFTSNLEWVDSSSNKKHAYKIGLKNPKLQDGENNGNAKLSEKDVKYIREKYTPYHKEFSGKALSKKFNISEALVYKIVRKEAWKHID